MSIKDFHIIFIIFSILLSLWFGIWVINNDGHPLTPLLRAMGGLSFIVAIALSVYCIRFIKKIRERKL